MRRVLVDKLGSIPHGNDCILLILVFRVGYSIQNFRVYLPICSRIMLWRPITNLPYLPLSNPARRISVRAVAGRNEES